MPSPSPTTVVTVHRPLCPACGADSIRIHLAVEVDVEVVIDDLVDEPEVVGESIGDADWDGDNVAGCPSCGWRGTVQDLRQHVLTGPAKH